MSDAKVIPIPSGARLSELERFAIIAAAEGFSRKSLERIVRLYNSSLAQPWDADLLREIVESATPDREETDEPARPSWPVVGEWLEALATMGEPIPTLVPALDLRLRGGMRVGKVLVLGGEPGSGKTSLLAQMAHRMAASGSSVCFWSGDEGPEAIAIRFAEHLGIARQDAERCNVDTMANFVRETAALRLFLPDPDKVRTLPELFEGLAFFPEARVLFIDSLQKIAAPVEREKTHEAIEDRMTAIRKLAARHRVIVFAASEIGRQAYTGNGKGSDLAAFKGSGGIEFGADVAAVIRPGERESEFRLAIAKNRIGTKGSFSFRFNPDTCLFSEVDPAEAERQATEDRNAKIEERAEGVLALLRERPGSSTYKLRSLFDGRPADLIEILRMLERTGRVIRSDGSRDADLWRAAE